MGLRHLYVPQSASQAIRFRGATQLRRESTHIMCRLYDQSFSGCFWMWLSFSELQPRHAVITVCVNTTVQQRCRQALSTKLHRTWRERKAGGWQIKSQVCTKHAEAAGTLKVKITPSSTTFGKETIEKCFLKIYQTSSRHRKMRIRHWNSI